MKRWIIAAGLLGCLAAGPAAARVDVGISIGVPYYPPAVIYQPPPVYVVPRPHVVRPPVYHHHRAYYPRSYYGKPHPKHRGHGHWGHPGKGKGKWHHHDRGRRGWRD